jgi:hypothetical protein
VNEKPVITSIYSVRSGKRCADGRDAFAGQRRIKFKVFRRAAVEEDKRKEEDGGGQLRLMQPGFGVRGPGSLGSQRCDYSARGSQLQRFAGHGPGLGGLNYHRNISQCIHVHTCKYLCRYLLCTTMDTRGKLKTRQAISRLST